MDEVKAIALPRRYDKMCSICMLIDSQAPNMKWHCFDEGYQVADDKYICDDCMKGMNILKLKCNQKIDNPKHDVFKDWMPWMVKEIPGMLDTFQKYFAEQKLFE